MTPGKKGALYAQRARIGLETARARGVVNREDPVVVAAQKDAAEAAKEGVAEGHFVLGRLAEETGRFDEAVRNYREAIKAHGKLDDAGSRYRIALARALLRSGAAEPVRARPLPPPVRTGKAEADGAARLASLDAVRLLVLFALQVPGLPAGVKAGEAEKIADEILALGDKVPFDVRAQAWAIKGMHTRALEVYAAGLRERGLLAPEYANALVELIDTHPALRRPESRTDPDPLAGERHYAAGLNAFAARRYADAERAFLSAVENDSGDARYFYFLGLSRLALGKRDAYEDFDQASRLERIGRPDRAAVSSALERVQGRMRRVLNEVRNRPVKDAVR
jgi:tetratricopeptide (TPR) repeat protein